MSSCISSLSEIPAGPGCSETGAATVVTRGLWGDLGSPPAWHKAIPSRYGSPYSWTEAMAVKCCYGTQDTCCSLPSSSPKITCKS